MEERESKLFNRMNLSESLKLYGIFGSENLKNGTNTEAVAQAIKGGMTCVQIREKHLSKRQLLETISEIKPICDEAGVLLIINDDAEICKASDANGVHLGLSDGSISEARKLLGDEKIIGATAHNLEEALAAEVQGSDYIGVGAAFGSNSKGNAVKLPNLEVYDQITSSVKIPVIAIGGINSDNIGVLAGRGLVGVAVISALFGSEDIEGSARKLRDASQELCNRAERTEI